MTEYIEICFPNGYITLLPGMLPAPAAQLRTILKWAEEANVDAVGPIKEWLEVRKEELQKAAEKWEKMQFETLQRFFDVSKQRDADRGLLRSYRGKDRYKAERPIVKQNIEDATRQMQKLRDLRSDELNARNEILREIKQLDRNKELIRQWEEQRKPTSPT